MIKNVKWTKKNNNPTSNSSKRPFFDGELSDKNVWIYRLKRT